MKTISIVLFIFMLALISCTENKQKEEEKPLKDTISGKEIVEIEIEETDNTPEWVNLADNCEGYNVMIELPKWTQMAALSFSGSFSGALEGSFSTNYLQIQIEKPYVFLNIYKGDVDLKYIKDSLLNTNFNISVLEEYPEGLIFKNQVSKNEEKFCLYEKVTIDEANFFINTGFNVYNFDVKDYINYSLDDVKYMQKVFRTIKPVE